MQPVDDRESSLRILVVGSRGVDVVTDLGLRSRTIERAKRNLRGFDFRRDPLELALWVLEFSRRLRRCWLPHNPDNENQ